ncbi:uncharacterized protein [Argopecten irradians]|uniref:uncharacterized protein n=1 Tax=Argopecten irradians TaxID=31199 RepID=UPI00371624E3
MYKHSSFCQRLLLLSRKHQNFPLPYLLSRGFRTTAAHNATHEPNSHISGDQTKQARKKTYQKATSSKLHVIVDSENQKLDLNNLYPGGQRAQSVVKNASQQTSKTNPHLSLFRKDGVDPFHYSLIYNNIKETEKFGTKHHLLKNVAIRLCLGWMVANFAFVSVVDFHVIPQHLQIVIVLAAAGYLYSFYRFYHYRKAYKETVFRLYKEKHGFNKTYIMVYPYRFTSSKQKVFTELEMKKLDPYEHPERFQVDWQKHRLLPDGFLPNHKSFLWEVLGHKPKND